MNTPAAMFVAAIFIGLIPATIASQKGRNFFVWWFYGAMLFIAALPMSIIIKPKEDESCAPLRKCPKCAELINPEAIICKHCHSGIEPLFYNQAENPEQKKRKDDGDHIPAWIVVMSLIVTVIFALYAMKTGHLPYWNNNNIAGIDSIFSSDYIIKVSGTRGLKFNGSYMTASVGGEAISKSVEGKVPAEYRVEGNVVSVCFQKQSEYGWMQVEIVKGKDIVSSSETSASYGVVMVASMK